MKVLSISTPKRYAIDGELWESIEVSTERKILRGWFIRDRIIINETHSLKRRVFRRSYGITEYGNWWLISGELVGYELEHAIEEYRHRNAIEAVLDNA